MCVLQNTHETLVHWVTHNNRDMQHGAAKALESFLKQVKYTCLSFKFKCLHSTSLRFLQ